jgi:signal peptidase I
MSIYQWFVFFLFIQLVHFGNMETLCCSWCWEAAVIVYNDRFDENNRSPQLVDYFTIYSIINLIMFPIIWVETLRSFGKRSNLDTFLAIMCCLYVYYVNYTQS